MDQHVHMRTGWWMPFVFYIDGNHDVIPIKHHRWYSNIMIGSKLLLSKKTWTSMCICVQAGGCLLYFVLMVIMMSYLSNIIGGILIS